MFWHNLCIYHFYVSSLKATQAEYHKKLEEVLTHFATLVSQKPQTIRFTLLVSLQDLLGVFGYRQPGVAPQKSAICFSPRGLQACLVVSPMLRLLNF